MHCVHSIKYGTYIKTSTHKRYKCIKNSILYWNTTSVNTNVIYHEVDWDHGRSVLVTITVRLEDNVRKSSNNLKPYDVYSKQPESFYGTDCYIDEH